VDDTLIELAKQLAALLGLFTAILLTIGVGTVGVVTIAWFGDIISKVLRTILK
jgi:hypothetical protein